MFSFFSFLIVIVVACLRIDSCLSIRDLHLSVTGLIFLCLDAYFEEMGLRCRYLTLYFVRIDLYHTVASEFTLLGKMTWA